MLSPEEQDNPWVTVTSDIVYDNPWIQVTHRDVITPTGTDGIYGVVHFKHRAIGVIPIDEQDHTLMVGQYRYPIDRYCYEIPEGGGPLTESPVAAARRELREECGLVAKTLEPLLECALSNSVTDEIATIYVARGLSPVPPDPDDTEVLDLHRLPVEEAIAMALRGEVYDSLTVMGLLRLALLRRGV